MVHVCQCVSTFISFHRVEYIEKSKNLQEQLKDLKTEIEVMKVEDKRTDLDRFHDENVQRGDNKYSTLRQVFYTFIWEIAK